MKEALRFNSDKPMMSYFMRSFPRMAEAIARVKEMGAIKYNDGNWRLGNKPDDEYWNSMFRHLNYIFSGEDYDPDTGCLHLAHAVWNMCALLELNHPDLPARDDEIWADRAAHWAAEKKIREAAEAEEHECKQCNEDCPSYESLGEVRINGEKIGDVTGFEFHPEPSIAPDVRPGDAVCFDKETNQFVKPLFGELELIPDEECPRCGSEVVWQETYGKECECGEVYDEPEGIEEQRKFEDAIKVNRPVAFDWTYDVWACSQCGGHRGTIATDGVIECMECGEISNVPIGPEPRMSGYDPEGMYTADPVIPAEYCEDATPITKNMVLYEWEIPSVPTPETGKSPLANLTFHIPMTDEQREESEDLRRRINDIAMERLRQDVERRQSGGATARNLK
jgi:hypothetical protein